ncbi:MAG: OmpH family outer membrane protein [Candidatus Lernaella stagnicola]|nr:OmpH family outer membrane protein [Candidatus Lernaella stagnicola]
MRKWIIVSVCLLAVAVATPAWAGKVGFVDLQRVLELTSQGQQISRDIEARQSEAKIKLKKMELEFVALRDSYEKTKDALTDEAKGQKQQELQQMLGKLQQGGYKAQMDLEAFKLENFRTVIAKVKGVAEKIAGEKGFDLVLLKVEDVMTEGSVVLYGSSSVDLTDEVVRRMNQ